VYGLAICFIQLFTDVPIGAWTTALALDARANGDPGMRRAATFAMGVGLLGALGAAISGLTDWSETQGRSRRTGLIHGLLNITATSLMATVRRFEKRYLAPRTFTEPLHRRSILRFVLPVPVEVGIEVPLRIARLSDTVGRSLSTVA
jgi:hypothetical protein